MGIVEPTIVWGRGTGRSGIGTVAAVLAPPSPASPAAWGASAVALDPVGLPAGGGVAPFDAEADAAAAAAASCLLSQAAEASKISGATQASQRMRLD
jgi:hypothetical protein